MLAKKSAAVKMTMAWTRPASVDQHNAVKSTTTAMIGRLTAHSLIRRCYYVGQVRFA